MSEDLDETLRFFGRTEVTLRRKVGSRSRQLRASPLAGVAALPWNLSRTAHAM